MYESKTKIIPAKDLEQLRNESREIEVDVVFEDDDAGVDAGAGAEAAAPEAEGHAHGEAEDEAAAAPTDAPHALDAAPPSGMPSDEDRAAAAGPFGVEGEDGDEQTLDDGRQLAFARGRLRAAAPEVAPDETGESAAEPEAETLDERQAVGLPETSETSPEPFEPPPPLDSWASPAWTAPPSTEPSPLSAIPGSQSSPDVRLLPGAAPPTAPPASAAPRSRPGSSPQVPPAGVGPVAPISPIGPATIPRPGPPRPSTQPKKG